MVKSEIQQGVIDVLVRKGLMDETQIIELLELFGEGKFYDFVFNFQLLIDQVKRRCECARKVVEQDFFFWYSYVIGCRVDNGHCHWGGTA